MQYSRYLSLTFPQITPSNGIIFALANFCNIRYSFCIQKLCLDNLRIMHCVYKFKQ